MSGEPILNSEPAVTKGVDFLHPITRYPKIVDRKAGIVEANPKREKVAIIGFAESSRMEAPFNDPEYECWGLNQLYRHIPRADRWFEIHTNWNEFVVEGTDHLGWCNNFPGPIYMTEDRPEIPNSIRYPIEKMIDGNMDYFQSTPAYMVALAIAEGFKVIDIYGIDLIVGQEWAYQKPNMEFWLGVAHGKGIQIGIPKTSALLKQRFRYGYQLEPESLVKKSELEKRTRYLQEQRHKTMIQLANIDGALQDTQLWDELATLRINGSQNINYEPPK